MGFKWDVPSGKRLKFAMKIHHVEWENSLFIWPSMAIVNSYGNLPEGDFSLT